MTEVVTLRSGVPVLLCDREGDPIAGAQDAVDLVGAAYGRADIVAVPVDRLDRRFFDLATGCAGEIMQKFVTYQTRLVVVGDITAATAASAALRALVHESNQGRQVWFVADLAELDARLA